MAEGTLRWLNEATGYGLIRPTDESRDLFMRPTNVAVGQADALEEGADVNYEVKQGRNATRATNVSGRRRYSWRDDCRERLERSEARHEYYALLEEGGRSRSRRVAGQPLAQAAINAYMEFWR